MASIANAAIAQARLAPAQGHGEGHRRVQRPAAAALRPAALHHLVQAAPEGPHRSAGRAVAAVFPTCLVEYQNPAIGQDLIKVYERNGVECTLVDGASLLRSAVAAQRRRRPLHQGRRQEREGRWPPQSAPATTSSSPSPRAATCSSKDYVDYVGGPDAELVAEHTFDACRVPDARPQGRAARCSTLDFPGDVPAEIAYHTPCHLRAQGIGLKSRDLMKLTGARIKLVQQCSGIDGMWGLRAENAELVARDRPEAGRRPRARRR